jgi:murein DD-endopeptidase MepM/ murein hydrolase activator NlpD
MGALATPVSARPAVMPELEPTEAAGTDFGLPFAEPAGLGSWYLAQPYGNTIYAYFERQTLYGAGQGLHMGLDFAAACGTPVVAIGDGTVRSVDGPGGALPHNLMISHPGGVVSFYGHLLRRPELTVGQAVRRGEVVALTGDMYETCTASPHLHLEIRDESLGRAFNPLLFIDADWHSLALIGASPQLFERDLDAPRRWQAMDDQPEIRFGGPLLNDFSAAWPSDGG